MFLQLNDKVIRLDKTVRHVYQYNPDGGGAMIYITYDVGRTELYYNNIATVATAAAMRDADYAKIVEILTLKIEDEYA